VRIMKQVWLTHQGNLRMGADLEISHAPSPQITPRSSTA
jgi:hypothetical protein